jgi:hypothetical protein
LKPIHPRDRALPGLNDGEYLMSSDENDRHDADEPEPSGTEPGADDGAWDLDAAAQASDAELGEDQAAFEAGLRADLEWHQFGDPSETPNDWLEDISRDEPVSRLIREYLSDGRWLDAADGRDEFERRMTFLRERELPTVEYEPPPERTPEEEEAFRERLGQDAALEREMLTGEWESAPGEDLELALDYVNEPDFSLEDWPRVSLEQWREAYESGHPLPPVVTDALAEAGLISSEAVERSDPAKAADTEVESPDQVETETDAETKTTEEQPEAEESIEVVEPTEGDKPEDETTERPDEPEVIAEPDEPEALKEPEVTDEPDEPAEVIDAPEVTGDPDEPEVIDEPDEPKVTHEPAEVEEPDAEIAEPQPDDTEAEDNGSARPLRRQQLFAVTVELEQPDDEPEEDEQPIREDEPGKDETPVQEDEPEQDDRVEAEDEPVDEDDDALEEEEDV